MELSAKDVARFLGMSERALLQWVKAGKIPAHRMNNGYHFSRSELEDWILRHKVTLSSEAMVALFGTPRPVRLAPLCRSGGIHVGIPGHDFVEVLRNSVEIIPLPGEITRGELFSFLVAREALVPTAVGRGIALPHPRHVVVTDVEHEQVSICFPHEPVSHGAVDAIPIHTLFITLSASPKRHLEIIGKLACLCGQESFLDLLRRRASEREILEHVERHDADWEGRLTSHD